MKKLGLMGVAVAALLLTGCSAPVVESAEDANYIAELRPRLTAEATDAELIALGREACSEFETGTQQVDLRLIEGEQPTATGKYADSLAIGYFAAVAYCPEAWD